MPRGRHHMRPPAYSAARPDLVRPVRTDPAGILGPTPNQARGPDWRATGGGHFVRADVELTPQQRVLEAAVLLPPRGMIVGWGALAWLGATWFDGIDRRTGRHLPVTMALRDHGIRAPRGATVCAEKFLLNERFVHDGVCIAEPATSVTYEMRYAATVDDAVRILDMTTYDDWVSIDEVHRHTMDLNARIGVGKIRDALPLADENAWSPTEVDMRRLLDRAIGLSGLLANRPIFDLHGRHLGTPDLVDAESGLVIEYDGKLHLAGHQRGKDLKREADFRRVGLEYVTMVASDWRSPTTFAQRVLEARRRALAHPTREWTLAQPPWWVPTETVAQRRALSQHQRQRYLRYRAG